MRDITHFLLATLLSLATLACRHDTPPADGFLSRQLPPDTKEILRQLNDRDNRVNADEKVKSTKLFHIAKKEYPKDVA